MKRPLLALALLASAAPAPAAVRTAGCVVESDRPIAAVNQNERVPAKERMPVEIRRLAPNRLELRVEGQAAGSGPFAPTPFAAKIAGIMISEADTPGYWLIGVIALETASGQRLIRAWQTTVKNGEPSKELEVDLSKNGSRSFATVAPAKQGGVPVSIACYAELPASPAK